jgi:translation initiation factor IF-2
MSKIRIYELARELGVDNKDVINCAQRLGMADKTSHSNSLEDYEADSIRRMLLRRALGGNNSQDVTNNLNSSSASVVSKASVDLRRAAVGASNASHAVEIRRDNIVMRRRRQDVPLQDESSLREIQSQQSDLAEINNNLPVAESKSIEPQISEILNEIPQQELYIEEELNETETALLNNNQALDVFTNEPLATFSSLSEEEAVEAFDSSISDNLESAHNLVDGVGEAVIEDLNSEELINTDLDPELITNTIEEDVGDDAFDAVVTEELVENQDMTNDLEPRQPQKQHYEDSFLSNFQTEAKVVGGPKVLGKIELPSKRTPKVEVKIAKEVDNKKWKNSAFTGDIVVDDDIDKKGKKARVKRREFSRNDLVDYDVAESKRGKSKASSHKSKNLQTEKAPKHEFSGPKASKRVVKVDEFITVGELAKQMSLKSGEIISKLISLGIMATINQLIDKDTATIVAEEFDYQVESVGFDEILAIGHVNEDIPSDLEFRPPVVTVMGHVDHGKTSLLDSIRSASVASREHGGITQHIGAYQVLLDSNKKITFIDTPGHEAFTSMRARGAQVTDIVVLVVAADDGVMPQTIEAVNHAKAANVSIVVAVNKMDKADANPDRVKQQLSEMGLQPEDWGGDTMYFPVSAIKKEGIEDLLEGILLLAEIKELRANYSAKCVGTVLEATQERGLGTVGTILVQRGTLSLGEIFVSGAEYGRVRSMTNDLGVKLNKATPSEPVQITGFNGVPIAGDDFIVVENESDAREIARNRAERLARVERAQESAPITLEELSRRTSEAALQELNVILKADVHGTAEAVKNSIERLTSEKVRVKVLHSAVGGINESDIQLAVASQGIVVGFGVRAEPRAMTLAESLGVEVRFYRVIYELLDDVEKAMVGLLAPEQEEVPLGRLEVRDTFSVPKIGVIAGGYVSDGIVKRGAHVRVLRDSRVIFEGRMGSLRRFKEDVKQVQSGYECGLGVENFNDIKIGDIIEVFEYKEIAPTLH